jgi:hypothetical protein
MLRFVGRLIMVPLGFLLAILAALGVLFTLGVERITHALKGTQFDETGIDLVFSMLHGFVGLAGVATIVPALLIVIIGEVVRIRSWLYYVLGGGAALAVLPLLASAGTLGSGGIANPGAVWPVFATAGFAGGLTYWLLAGRNA